MSHRAALLGLLLLVGCAHRVSVQSVPTGALATYGDRALGATPVELTVWSNPFARPEVGLAMPGYRSVSIDLSKDRRPVRRVWELFTLRWRKALGLAPAASHEVLLVKVHGPAGTWTSEDVEE